MTSDSRPDPADRTAARITVGALPGYVFAGDGVALFCFVPEDLVAFGPAGEVVVDLPGYVRTGWSQRNMRSSNTEAGMEHVFPDGRRLIDHRTIPDLDVQLERWRRLAEADAQLRD